MDDIMGKIQSILSDEESMQQIKELASMLKYSTNSEEENSDSPPHSPDGDENTNTDGGDESGEFNFDFDMLLKLQGLMGVFSQKDKNSDLLMALKPHLSSEKQLKIDKAVKILKLLSVWTVLKESGILKDFL